MDECYYVCVRPFLGVSQRCFFMDTDERTDDVMMQINYKAPRTLTQGVIPGSRFSIIMRHHILCATVPFSVLMMNIM